MNTDGTDIAEKLSMLKCCIIIPTYNNHKTVGNVIADAKKYCRDVIVVNDGSTDGTDLILERESNLQIITHTKNKGKGEALKTGLKHASEKGFSYAIVMDSDGQHFADDIPAFAKKLEENPDAFIVGIRNLSQDNMPQKNTFANKFSNFWFRFETGQNLSDTQCGFRCYPLNKMKGMRFITGRYEFELEVLVRLAWKGVKLLPLPIKVYYAPEGERVSHFKPIKDFTRISILNTILVLITIIWIKPRDFFKSLSKKKIQQFIKNNITESKESNIKISFAIAFGVFMGIFPVWGYQLILALTLAHILKLNKVIVTIAANISLPPMIPFILYGSYKLGGIIMGTENPIDIDSLTIKKATENLIQFFSGGAVLAVICGIISWTLSLSLLSLFRKNKK